MGLQRSWLPQPYQALSLGLAAETWPMEDTTPPGRVVWMPGDNSWFSRALQKLGLGLVSIWQSWIISAFPVIMAMGFQVSCFVAGFLCDLFFKKWKLFLGCSKLSEASALCLHQPSGGSPTRSSCPCLPLLPVIVQHSCQVAQLGVVCHAVVAFHGYSQKSRNLMMMLN